jgi:hypothetical protein
MADVIVPRETRRQLAALRGAGTTGEVTFMGKKAYAWEGTLVSKGTYKTLRKGAVPRT